MWLFLDTQYIECQQICGSKVIAPQTSFVFSPGDAGKSET